MTKCKTRTEWLDLLNKCQNGDATCMFVLGEIERENAEELRQVRAENARLRAIFPKILEALNSGACSSDCSVEFMEQIPNEVRLVIRGHSPVVDETDKQNR